MRVAPLNASIVLEQAARFGVASTHERWASEQVDSLPARWAAKIIGKWRQASGDFASTVRLRESCKAIRGAMRAGLPADANDGDLCEEAHQSARDMERRLGYVDRSAAVLGVGDRLHMLGRVMVARAMLEARGIADAFDRLCRVDIRGALARVVCERWWRRVLRVLHARAVEATARSIGLVHKRAGCYVSDETLARRRGQRARNAAALESVEAENEDGQRYTLAELAAKGPANREIRRHELMVRIAGFEQIARDLEHEAFFVTVTCPSRMHAYRTRRAGIGVEANPKHDGTKPDEAQRYLAKQWGRFLAACQRWGVELYGFRIAEPNHDGTPHWHALLFLPRNVGAGMVRANPRAGRPVAGRVALRLLRRYFLHNADGDESGAHRHRVAVERIDWSRGSAAGYVAKYVSKNIDGYRVEKDLYGNDAMQSSQRVDAWAATWRIRQFQQIGGAPVGIWRELRRLHPEQAGAAYGIALALDAVNIAADAPDAAGEQGFEFGKVTAAHGWAAYVDHQGGPRVRRADLRVRLAREATGEIGRYGETLPAKAIGVETDDIRIVKACGIILRPDLRRVTVRVVAESERKSWRIVGPGGPALPGGEAARPWSPVNNSTRRPFVAPRPLFAPIAERHRKRGKFKLWGAGRRNSQGVDPP